MKNNNMKIFAALLVLLLSVSMLTGCRTASVIPPDPEVSDEPLEMDLRSVLLQSGETVKLTVEGENVTFVSSDPQVASVDENGNIKALKKGNAMITATCDGKTAVCGVMVDAQGDVIDLSSHEAVEVVPPVQMYQALPVISFAADPEGGAYYLSQQYGHKIMSDSLITKVTQVDGVWQRTSYVHLYNHGFGYFGIEKEGDKTYLLTESNGVLTNQGTTISRVLWEDKVLYDEEFGDTFTLGGLEGSPRPQSSMEDDVIVVYDFNGRQSYYTVYDRDALLSGQENNYLHRFTCLSRQTPTGGEDDSDGKYNSAIRGFAYKNGYIYQLSGSGACYVSVFDLEGKLIYCHQITEHPDLPGLIPGSIAISGNDIYVAVSTGSTTTVTYASVWKLEEAAQ